MPVLPDFGSIRFSGTLRPSQKAASSVIIPQLESGKKRLHIVAPPGSGKTVLGLYVWADLVRKPALVLSPNSAIQAQWAARTSLFDLDGKDEFISTDPKKPGLLTSLTYQSVTMPRKGGEDLDKVALELWAEKLIEDGEAMTHEEANAQRPSSKILQLVCQPIGKRFVMNLQNMAMLFGLYMKVLKKISCCSKMQVLA